MRLPHISAKLDNGKNIYITHLEDSWSIGQSEQSLRVRGDRVFAFDSKGNESLIGNRSPACSSIETKEIEAVSWEYNSGLNALQAKDLYERANTLRQNLLVQTPDSKLTELETALWHHTFTKNPDNLYKNGTLAFSIFPESVLKQVETLNFTNFKLVGLDKPFNGHGDRHWGEGEKVRIEVVETSLPTALYTGSASLMLTEKVWEFSSKILHNYQLVL